MERIERNNKTLILFILVLIILIVGGFFLIRHLKNNNTTIDYSKSSSAERIKKKDKDKDLIYIDNIEEISEEWQLSFKDIVFNFDGNEELQNKLNDEMKKVKNSLIKKSDKKEEVKESDEETDNDDDIFSVDMIDYQIIESNRYISLIVSKYSYNCNEGITDKNYDYYVFDITNGKLLENQDIMKKEKVTDQKIRAKIRDYINGDENVDIDVTLNNPYHLTIAKNGNIVLNFIVKSNDLNYNVSIEMSD